MKKDTVPIKLLSGPYKDVVYRYTKLEIREKETEEVAVMKFEYELCEMGEHTEIKLRRDPKFNEHIGLVLNTLILESLSAPQFETKAPE
jgi:hemerythrin superfamily protein